MDHNLMNQLLADVEKSAKGRTMNSADSENQRRRNLRRNIDSIADLLYKTFSPNGNAWPMTYDNTEKVSRIIMSEVFGHNSADLDIPVDDKICKQADDILAQIRAKQTTGKGKTVVTNPLMFSEIKQMADEIVAFGNNEVDPFDAAMSIMEKK